MGKKILAELLLILATMMNVSVSAAYYDSFGNYFPDPTVNYGNSADDGIRAALGDATFNAMQQGISQNGGVSADDGIRAALGDATFNAMQQGISQNGGYTNYGTGDALTTWFLSNQGTASTSGPYDSMRVYLGNAVADYLNSNRNNPDPYWANADTSQMTPIWVKKYNDAKADLYRIQDERWKDLGRYGW